MSTVLDDLFATNTTAEEDGVWVDVTATLKLKVRAYSAKVVGDLRDKLTKPYQMLLRQNLKIPDEQNEDIALKVIAGGVLADWKGLTAKNQDGVEVDVPFTAETAYDYLKRLPKLANFIVGVATDSTFFKDEELREDGAKN
ncbi:pre-tape measure chaperone protein [Caulobacter phage C1]|nr:pre-tape measure chaperone protein [Caulobacter phage C1]UTU08381.1 pre-tape measure chaperone protein [Caulobacter phage C2]UTU08898.1 pre-tape measure chaperone protein [Caulobacter phage J4]UTU09454.1 pre-tape measure chaperone protein [Caulobacter phage BL47]UTU10014.1 pre-tape measure chaperone protein [Caulobacter phage RB23]WGN97039.1 pre-tape measure chaperone protein [Bertelyvirus sp.]